MNNLDTTKKENTKEQSFAKEIYLVFVDFFKENEMIKYILFILLAAGGIFLFNKIISLKFLTIFSYTLGIILLGFVVFYAYRDFSKSRTHLNKLEEAFDNTIDNMVEKEIDEEIIQKAHKKITEKKENN